MSLRAKNTVRRFLEAARDLSVSITDAYGEKNTVTTSIAVTVFAKIALRNTSTVRHCVRKPER